MSGSESFAKRAGDPPDARDEILGERLRLALDGAAARGEPDFAAVYRRAGSREAPRAGNPVARRAHRALLAFPAAAALAAIVALGGRGTGPADDEAAIRAELRSLAGELSGAREPDRPAPDDLFSSELERFIADLWNPSLAGID